MRRRCDRLPRQYGRIRADPGGFGHWSRLVPKRMGQAKTQSSRRMRYDVRARHEAGRIGVIAA